MSKSTDKPAQNHTFNKEAATHEENKEHADKRRVKPWKNISGQMNAEISYAYELRISTESDWTT